MSPLDSKPIKLVDLKTSVQGTIDRLGFHPDLLLIHAPITYEEGQLVPFWKALEAMKDSGELRSSLGVSNFRPQDLNTLLEIAKYKPVVNRTLPEYISMSYIVNSAASEIEFHPFVLAHLEPVLAIHEKYGIVTESYGPLTPILRHKATGGPLLPVFDKIIKRLSSEPGVSTSLIDNAAVLLLWCRAKSVVAVTTSGNVERLNNILAVQSLPDLTPEEVKQIDDVGKKYHYRYYSGHMSKEFPHPDLPTGEE